MLRFVYITKSGCGKVCNLFMDSPVLGKVGGQVMSQKAVTNSLVLYD